VLPLDAAAELEVPVEIHDFYLASVGAFICEALKS
jgi:hypothetical protein